IRWIELPLTLAVLPLTLAIGFFWVATWPTLNGIFALQIGQRVLTYGLMGPAREILFTVATREEKYKSKGLIDTAIFRAGDTLSAYLHTAMKSNLPGQNPSWWMIPICVIWGILGLCIGGAQRRRTVP
ncbi:MAG: hypothetical protein O3C60_01265, partial [Planctomycetota bacterium]|nr:hypothetical protein [Planctomycetota bacterium]